MYFAIPASPPVATLSGVGLLALAKAPLNALAVSAPICASAIALPTADCSPANPTIASAKLCASLKMACFAS